MKRWVMLGGGANHYELIRQFAKDPVPDCHILLVSSEFRIPDPNVYPQRFLGLITKGESYLDLWKVCQKASVDFIDDSVIRLDRSRQVVELLNNGPMPFDHLTIECVGESIYPGFSAQPMPSVAPLYPQESFLQAMKKLSEEVHRHVPREIKIVFSGNSIEVCQWALLLKNRLGKTCMDTKVRIVSSDSRFLPHVNRWHRRALQTTLESQGVRWTGGIVIESLQPHRIDLSSGETLEVDVYIPGENFRPSEVYQRVLAGRPTHIPVEANMALRGEENIFIHGQCLWGASGHQSFHPDLRKQQQVHLKEHWRGPSGAVHRKDRPQGFPSLKSHHLRSRGKGQKGPYKNYKSKPVPWSGFITSENQVIKNSNGFCKTIEVPSHDLRLQALHELKERKKIPGVFALADQEAQEQEDFEAYNSRRPWEHSHQFFTERAGKDQLQQVCTFGYNWWGDTARSSRYLTQLVLAKALCQGLLPESVRISLVIPEEDPIWAQHLFQTSVKAVEAVLEKEKVSFAGGDTMKGPHWSLNLTVAGPQKAPQKGNPSKGFSNGDYMLLTRPLGLGLLWSRRTQDQFQSQWFEDAVDYPVCPGVSELTEFLQEFDIQTAVMVEEWGFLYHCFQELQVDQQMMVNFRHLPKWQGVDQVLETPVKSPALDKNWQRVRNHVNFDRDNISKGNAILWDSRSHGAMVIGVSSTQWEKALASLKKMGFTEATLVGCVREQRTSKRMVLSDWNAQV